jgi:hypothetical protein
VTQEVLVQTSFPRVEKTRHPVPVGEGEYPPSMIVVEQRERISLRASWSSSGVANGKSNMSGCAYGWEETSTPLSSCFTFSSSHKYFHTLCIILNVMMKYMSLLFSILVSKQLLENLFDFYTLLYLYNISIYLSFYTR